MLGHAGYRYAVRYARERHQGRLLSGKDPSQAPVPIIEHADVRRMLLAQKAWSEGGMALCLYAARLVDDARTAPDETRQREATLLLDLLTPICKAWPSIYGPRANDLAIQVLGGYGYTRDFPVEQHYRDNRLNPIHEGTNGIQALDLLGRKVGAAGGAGMALLGTRIAATIDAARKPATLAGMADALSASWARIAALTSRLNAALAQGKREEALADASLYLEALGHVVVAWLWLEQALRAERLLASGGADSDYLHGKLQACRYFFVYELPHAGVWCDTIERMEGICLSTAPEWL
jgi:butyryl-CoA dehydrogenase